MEVKLRELTTKKPRGKLQEHKEKKGQKRLNRTTNGYQNSRVTDIKGGNLPWERESSYQADMAATFLDRR